MVVILMLLEPEKSFYNKSRHYNTPILKLDDGVIVRDSIQR